MKWPFVRRSEYDRLALALKQEKEICAIYAGTIAIQKATIATAFTTIELYHQAMSPPTPGFTPSLPIPPS